MTETMESTNEEPPFSQMLQLEAQSRQPEQHEQQQRDQQQQHQWQKQQQQQQQEQQEQPSNQTPPHTEPTTPVSLVGVESFGMVVGATPQSVCPSEILECYDDFAQAKQERLTSKARRGKEKRAEVAIRHLLKHILVSCESDHPSKLFVLQAGVVTICELNNRLRQAPEDQSDRAENLRLQARLAQMQKEAQTTQAEMAALRLKNHEYEVIIASTPPASNGIELRLANLERQLRAAAPPPPVLTSNFKRRKFNAPLPQAEGDGEHAPLSLLHELRASGANLSMCTPPAQTRALSDQKKQAIDNNGLGDWPLL